MPSSERTVEESPEAVVKEPGRKPRAIPRRALLALGALGAAARAEAQVRTPTRSRPQRAPRPEIRLLRRTTMGVTAEDISWVNSLGYYGYLEWQLNAQAMGDPDCETRLTQFPTIYLPPDQLYVQPDSQVVTRNITEAAICRAVYTNRQLLERMVEFWADHFNTNITSVGVLKTPEVRNVYLQHGLGTFPAMLSASASSPAMLIYLNNTQSDGRRISTNPDVYRVPNQNYARELLELHTLGVDGGYTQQDVMEVARCFTGWRTTTSNSVVSAGAGPGTFYYDSVRHDNRSKLVLGNTIAAGGGINDGLNVLSIVANHPSTARFIATKMLRWLLTYDPSPSLVADIAGEYTRTGGDIKSIVRRILQLRQCRGRAAALEAPVPLHRFGAPRRECQRDVLRHDPRDVSERHGQHPVCLGTAGRLPAGVRVLGRPAAAALELRVPAGQQQRQRRGGRRARPDGGCDQRHPGRRPDRRSGLRRRDAGRRQDGAHHLLTSKRHRNRPVFDPDSRRPWSGNRVAGVPVALTAGA